MTAKLVQHDRRDIASALKKGMFTLSLGPFKHLVSGASEPLLDFLYDTYRDYDVALQPTDVSEIILNLKAPNFLRRFIRPQVSPDPGFEVPTIPLPLEMAPLAFEMGMNLSVALKCCRFVTVHAGVVANEMGAIVMSAASGSGKSTLSAALANQGYRLFSDEFALIDLDDAMLHPYPRPISLKQESIAVVRDIVGADRISVPLSGTPKGDIAYCRVAESDLANAHRKAAATLILFPRYEAGVSPMARKLNPAEAVMRLIPASTNYSLLGEPAFKAVLKLVRQARAYELSYGTTEQSLQLIADLQSSGAGR